MNNKPILVRFRLSLMMFLQYAVWGAWSPLAARYLSASVENGGLGFSSQQIGMILGLAGSIGAVSAPFIAGQIADRYFSTERVLAFLILVGGLVKWYTATQTTYKSWLLLSILYSVLYMPTLALSNSITFSHLTDRDRDFPKIRVWGTIGWIVASWVFAMFWLQKQLGWQWMPPFLVGVEVEGVTRRLADSLTFAGVLSIIYAGFCLFLPNTPPKKNATEKLAFKKAFALLQRPNFTVLVLASLIVSVIHQIYFLQAGPFLSYIGLKDSQIGPATTIGQFAEILTMAFLGYFIKRLGFRKVITIGTFAYFARYVVFGMTNLPVWLIVISQAFHGFCYAFFFAAAFIYVDKVADEDVRHSAQTVFGIIILGGGPVLSGFLSGALENVYTPEGGDFNFSQFWYTLAVIGLVATLFFVYFFRSETEQDATEA